MNDILHQNSIHITGRRVDGVNIPGISESTLKNKRVSVALALLKNKGWHESDRCLDISGGHIWFKFQKRLVREFIYI